MIRTFCQECGIECSEISVYDAEFTGEPTCWKCIFNACSDCNGQGYTGWSSSDGDFDFDWCDCNPLHLTLADF
mgnify:CR=1 FL=1